MGRRKVIETYYSDINNLSDILTKLVSSYRLLIGGADELNKIALSKKNDVKGALKRADKLGDIIDELIKTLEQTSGDYQQYCELKSEIIRGRMDMKFILNEIDEELLFKE
ncbi:hypothetical protein OW763_02295 [Clostridium aestuarii]|uniref:Uncharacterized protein n=1 Tax=Clostridium aestuarii TaxID=338193 RepID=A0ABT4CYI5_9CLOT|nr:hypothetical protein [Clostridium aestuarii]MCY6483185.1 hypothetical protein [Clostridium aestuarii]